MPRPRIVRPAAPRLDATLDDRPGELLVGWLRESRWLDDAACGDSDDPDMWFVEPSMPDRTGLSSPRSLEAFLICAGCPVRRDCLSDALTTWRVVLPRAEREGTSIRSVGVWGATTETDRAFVRSLPIADAIDKLELELPDRLRTRIEAFETYYPRDGRQNRQAKRVWELLEEMRAGHATDEVHEINATP